MAINSAYTDIWQDCLERLREQTTDDEYGRWFKPLSPVGYDGVYLQIRVPNEDYIYHIEQNYIATLRKVICDCFGEKTKLRYAIPQKQPAPVAASAKDVSTSEGMNDFVRQSNPNPSNIKNPFVIPGLRKLVIDSQLNPNYTFESFVEGDCNRLARAAGAAVALNPGRTPYNPLYIFGEPGLGKTHVAQAIGMEIKKNSPDLNVLYVSMNKFQAQYTTAMINHEPNDFISFYQLMDVLIIDDIQELSGNKASTQNAFFNIFNYLHLSGKQLILTSDKRPSELKDINERLLTRFKWGLSAELTRPDYDTKRKIIAFKAQRLGMPVTEEIADYIAANIVSNVREIEGVLSAVAANSTFLGREVTISLVKDVMRDYVVPSKREITIDVICDAVCDFLNMDKEMFFSSKRTREIAQARQIAMYLCKHYTNAPLATIGSSIGGKNHATVLYACRQVNNLMDTEKSYANIIHELERRIKVR